MTDPIQVSELEPCPFCKGPAAIDTGAAEHLAILQVVCTQCGGMGPFADTADGDAEARCVELWNTRAMKAAEPLPQGDERSIEELLYEWQSDQSEWFNAEVREIVGEFARWYRATLVRSPIREVPRKPFVIEDDTAHHGVRYTGLACSACLAPVEKSLNTMACDCTVTRWLPSALADTHPKTRKQPPDGQGSTVEDDAGHEAANANPLASGDEVERVALAEHALELVDLYREHPFRSIEWLGDQLAALVRSKPDDVRERVARAICEASGQLWRTRDEIPASGLPRDFDFDDLNNHWRHKADAAITAIGSQSIERERG